MAFEPKKKRRKKPGRKASKKGRVPHRARPKLAGKHPVHVTYRMAKDVKNLRRFKVWRALTRAFVKANKDGFRICQFSVQGNHVHLICEADDERALSQGLRGFATSVSKRFHGLMGRTGSAFEGRYHVVQMTSPLQVRHTLCYVLQNARRHGMHRGMPRGWVDPYSSFRYFDGWDGAVTSPPEGETPLVAPAKTWLLRVGWKRHGLIGLEEMPAAGRW